MNYEKVLRSFLSKTLKMDAGQIDALLTADNEETLETNLLDADKTRVATLSTPKKGTTFQDGYAKAKGEVLTQVEKEIKEKFGVDADVTGVSELVDLVISEKVQAGGKAKDLTDDDVKKHPAYQQMEKGFKRTLAEKETEYNNNLTAKDREFNRTKTLSTINSKAQDILNALNPVLSKSPTVAQNIKNSFLSALAGYDYDLQDTGIVITKDGKVVDDGHGHSLTFDELVKTHAANFFEFSNNNGGANGGNDNNQQQGGDTGKYPAGITPPKTYEDLEKILADEKFSPEDRYKAMDVWESEHSATQ
jgi:hypothetical protein